MLQNDVCRTHYFKPQIVIPHAFPRQAGPRLHPKSHSPFDRPHQSPPKISKHKLAILQMSWTTLSPGTLCHLAEAPRTSYSRSPAGPIQARGCPNDPTAHKGCSYTRGLWFPFREHGLEAGTGGTSCRCLRKLIPLLSLILLLCSAVVVSRSSPR